MNTLKEVQDTIKEVARRHGFEAQVNRFLDIPDITSENLNFQIAPIANHYGEWKNREVHISITASASIRRMGGNPSADELLLVADEIRRGAELVKDIQAMDLSYVRKV